MPVRFFVAMLVCSVLDAQQRPVGRGVNFYSYEKEAALGSQLAGEMRRQTTALDSDNVHEYVDGLGRRLAAQLPNAHFTYTFAVITDAVGGRTLEPIALPGGYVFVPASLILTAQNEAEFAGMLAHSIAHVAARHGTRQATRGELVHQASIPLIYLGGWSGRSGNDALIPIGFLGIQRAYELEADRLATGMMAGAGYDPSALAQYIGRTQPPNTDLQEMRSALPSVSKRIAAIEVAIHELPQRSYANGEEFPTIQQEVRGRQPPPPPPSLPRRN